MASGSSDWDTLSKLLQMGTVAEYQNEFEILINRVTGISENLLKSMYISGLKPLLQCALLRLAPTTLGEACSIARILEVRFEIIAGEKLNIEEKIDIVLSWLSEEGTYVIKESLDTNEYIGVVEVSSAINDVLILARVMWKAWKFVVSLANFQKIKKLWKMLLWVVLKRVGLTKMSRI
jgi:hypothetical protein